MTVEVLDSKDQVQAVLTGIIPVPPGIAEDNAAQAKKRGQEAPKAAKIAAPPAPDADSTSVVVTSDTAAPEPEEPNPDDVEDEDGLTPRQKREYTAAMLKTIGKKTRQMREAQEREAEEYNQRQLAERRADDLSRELERIKAQNKPVEPAPAKAPDRKDFETDAAYADALIDYRVDQKLIAKAREDAKQREEQRQEQIKTEASARIAKAIELVPDYVEVTEAADMTVPAAIAGYMQESDMFAELGYHLAKHPEVLDRLAKLNPAKQLVEIGKIESTLEPFAPAAKANGKEPSPQPNGAKPSQTGPDPSKPRVVAPVIRPLSGASAAQVDKPETDKSQREIISDYERKQGIRLTARKRH